MPTTDIIQSIGIIATLAIAIWQMIVQTRHVRAANDLAILSKFDEITKIYIEDPKLWHMLDDEFNEDSEDTRHSKLSNVIFVVFNTLELTYRHYKKYRMLCRDGWSDWKVSLDIYIGKKFIEGWWKKNAIEYPQDFRSYVESQCKFYSYQAESIPGE